MKKILFLLTLLYIYRAEAQNLGVGVNPPTQKLDVAGNVKFTGTLKPNNSAGNANDVLLSQGAGLYPVWGDATAGQMWASSNSNDSINLIYDGGVIDYSMPGMSITFSVVGTGIFDAFLYTDGAAQWTSNIDSDNNSIKISVSLWLDGVKVRNQLIFVDNTENFGSGLRSWSISSQVSNITAGVHTFEVKGKVVGTTGALPTTVTFCDKNIVGKPRIGSVNVALIRK